ncbi:N-acetyltransferase [Gordonia jinhuaensis]|uniref:N-acetyltransferase n=1 Tax=Gordonia jinhuaensis TaxID=1517702 RepID=A0A916T8F9_9ACTN|nr:N-acetyltransferase [Gordonia jinhuaensis]
MRATNLAAFETSEEADLVDALRDDDAWVPELSVVAVDPDSDEPVGYALLTRCRIDDEPALALAPCAVQPRYQGVGVGSSVIEAALDFARNAGEQVVVVLGHPGYYPRFGFTRASEHGVKLSIDVPDDALMVLSLDGSPIPSGTVRYAAPFGI